MGQENHYNINEAGVGSIHHVHQEEFGFLNILKRRYQEKNNDLKNPYKYLTSVIK